MKKTMFNVLLFTMGAAVGSLVTWKVVKTKYEKILQEEIDSVKETWTRLNGSDTSEKDNDEDNGLDEGCDDDEEDLEGLMSEYTTLASRYNRSSEDKNDEEGGGDDEVPYINGPYVIKPEDFGDGNFEHDLYCVNYYADGILADDWGVKLDIEETIGEDSLDHIGDYTEDVVHVRNERLQVDYEVTRDPRNYAEAAMIDPRMQMYAN